MKLSLLVLLICCLVCLSAASSQPEQVESSQVEATARSRFRLPRLFDFDRYKQLFAKRYASLLEEIARKKLFLARAFQAMLSAIGYKNGKQSSYQALNQMSDWTEEELKRVVNYEKSPRFNAREDGEEIKVASEEEIEAALAELERRAVSSGRSEIANELHDSHRQRRDAQKRRQLTLDDLIERPQVVDAPERLVEAVESNNPDYEPPELQSEGTADETGLASPMSSFLAEQLAKLPGAQQVWSALNAFWAGDEFEDASDEMVVDEPKTRIADFMYFDHREKGCISPIKNQGDCGSCYIFSTIALYEWMHCRDTGEMVAFSEQYPIDCGSRMALQGCQGGTEVAVARFYASYGFELQSKYPYRMREEQCPYSPTFPSYSMGYLRIKEKGLLAMKPKYIEKYLKQTPILIGIFVTRAFQFYGGGVDEAKDCQQGSGHAVMIVGHGVEDGQEYWLIRNSYSSRWGEEGYYKLSKDADCFMDEMAFLSEASFEKQLYKRRNIFYEGIGGREKKQRI